MQARDRSFLRRNDFVDFIGRSVSYLELRTSFRKRDDVFSPVPVSKFLLLVRFAFRIICGSQEVAQLLISFTMQASIWNLERSQGYVIIFLKRVLSHIVCVEWERRRSTTGPLTCSISSWYLSSTPSVFSMVSSVRAFLSKARRAETQSRVSATPGRL